MMSPFSLVLLPCVALKEEMRERREQGERATIIRSSANVAPLLGLLQLLLTLALQKLLLSLSIHGLELLIALSLLGLLALEVALFSLEVIVGLLNLRDGIVTGGADLAKNLRPQVGILDKDVGKAEEVGEDGEDILILLIIRGQSVSDKDALAGRGVIEGDRLISRLIGDEEILEEITSLLRSLGKLRSQEEVGDLSALAHDSKPRGKVGVVLGRGDGGIVALITDGLHAVLVDDGPDEAVVARLLNLGLVPGDRGHGLGLPSVKGVQNSIDTVDGGGKLSKREPRINSTPPRMGLKRFFITRLMSRKATFWRPVA